MRGQSLQPVFVLSWELSGWSGRPSSPALKVTLERDVGKLLWRLSTKASLRTGKQCFVLSLYLSRTMLIPRRWLARRWLGACLIYQIFMAIPCSIALPCMHIWWYMIVLGLESLYQTSSSTWRKIMQYVALPHELREACVGSLRSIIGTGLGRHIVVFAKMITRQRVTDQ